MASVVRMPGISADADEATLVEWAVASGDEVRRGDVIATVETDKAVVDIEAEDDGVLLVTFASAGETVTVGGPMAVLLQAGEQATDEKSILAGLGLGGEQGLDAPVPGEDLHDGAGRHSSGPLAAADEERSQDDLALGSKPPIEHTVDQVVSRSGQHASSNEAGSNEAGSNEAGTNGAGSGGRAFATPLVRRLAAEGGTTLDGLTGTGPNGRIRLRDLEAARAATPVAVSAAAASTVEAPTPATTGVPVAPPATPESTSQPGQPARPSLDGSVGTEYTDEPVSRFRRAVAAALTASKQNVPHFYLKATCQVDALLELRTQLNLAAATKITINDFVVKAAAVAMQRVPQMNVVWTGDAVRRFASVDLTVAMATDRGLVVPVVRSVESRSLSDLSAAVKDLASRAAANTLQQRELEGGSLAISNLGMYGVEEFTAIINPPQVAILAVGAVSAQAVEGEDGTLVLARCLKVVLSVDHRPVDGALAAQWLQQFKTVIENPLQLVV